MDTKLGQTTSTAPQDSSSRLKFVGAIVLINVMRVGADI